MAKNTNINLSGEFEEWIKTRMNITNEEGMSKNDIDNEIVRYQQEIQKLKSMSEIMMSKEMIEKEKLMVLDNIIDNQIKFKKDDEKLSDIPEQRGKSIIFLFKKKFHDNLTTEQAVDIIENRMKERGLL